MVAGFPARRGNSFPLAGFSKRVRPLTNYAPDSVNNYELGLKGRFSIGLSYTFAVFDIDWDKPQISAALPSGNLAVYNGNTARSKGFEFESSGPLMAPGLTYNLSYAYADAKLTSNFALPANDGTGNIVPGIVTGTAGQQLPGSPKVSAAGTVAYTRQLAPDYSFSVSLSDTYKSHAPLGLSGQTADLHTSAFGIMNFSATLTHREWRLLGYVTNLADKRAILGPPTRPNLWTASRTATSSTRLGRWAFGFSIHSDPYLSHSPCEFGGNP